MSSMTPKIDSAGEGFIQPPIKLPNAYVDDTILQGILTRLLENQNGRRFLVCGDLEKFGEKVVNELDVLADECEMYPPSLQQFDVVGNRTDVIHTCAAWKQMHKISAAEGLVGFGYNAHREASSEFARVHQFAKLHLYSPASGMYNCPLAMTDGAAKLIENLPEDIKKTTGEALQRLTSGCGDKFWTSGQWMTERAGGSDVANGTRTVARLHADGTYRLWGYKWFTSAIDCDVTITLARIEDKDGKTIPGTHIIDEYFSSR